MIKKWKALLAAKDPDTFYRVFGILFSSSVLVQGITLLGYPLITRWYEPEQLGEKAIFFSLITILVPLATMGYEIALNVPPSEKEGRAVAASGLSLSIALGVLLSLLIWIGGQFLFRVSGLEAVYHLRWLIPPAVTLGGIAQVFYHWMIRRHFFKGIARIRVLRALVKSGIELPGGWFAPQSLWLILGVMIGNIVGIIGMGRRFIKDNQGSWAIDWSLAWKSFGTYRDFPRFFVGAAFLRKLQIELPVLLLGAYFGLEITGQYSIAYAAMGVLCAVLIDTFSNVHLAKLAKVLQDDLHQRRHYFRKMLQRLLLLGGVPASILLWTGPWLIRFLFGNEWEQAGEFFRLLMAVFCSFYMYAFAFHIFNLTGNQRTLLLFNGLRLMLALAGMVILLRFSVSAFQMILYFGVLDLSISGWQLWDAYRRLFNYTAVENAD